ASSQCAVARFAPKTFADHFPAPSTTVFRRRFPSVTETFVPPARENPAISLMTLTVCHQHTSHHRSARERRPGFRLGYGRKRCTRKAPADIPSGESSTAQNT